VLGACPASPHDVPREVIRRGGHDDQAV